MGEDLANTDDGLVPQDIKRKIEWPTAEVLNEGWIQPTCEVTTSPDLHELFGAMAKAQGEMQKAAQTKTNDYFDSVYADYADVWEVAHGPLAANGLSVMHFPMEEDGKAGQLSWVCHESGQWMRSKLMLPVPLSKDGTRRTTSYVAVTTYAKRINMQSICNIAADEDEDMQAVEHPKIDAATVVETIMRIEALSETDKGKKAMITRFCKKFGVEKIEDLTLSQFPQADEAIRDKETGK